VTTQVEAAIAIICTVYERRCQRKLSHNSEEESAAQQRVGQRYNRERVKEGQVWLAKLDFRNTSVAGK
jgi:hypothetical protein